MVTGRKGIIETRTVRVMGVLMKHEGQWVCSKDLAHTMECDIKSIQVTIGGLRRKLLDKPEFEKRIDTQRQKESITGATRYRLIDSTACYYCGQCKKPHSY